MRRQMANIKSIFETIAASPALLTQECPEMVAALKSRQKKGGQGVANQTTSHEGCFARLVEERGFKPWVGKDAPTEPGLYYTHQTGGSQMPGDFRLTEIAEGVSVSKNVELKHTMGKTFYLNDGWFETGVVYVISWVDIGTRVGRGAAPRIPRVLIANGEDIPTPEEVERYREIREFLKKMNSGEKKTGSLRVYLRCANQYTCDRFTPEFTTSCLARVNAE